MNKFAHALLAFAAPLCLLAADFPEGTGAITITEPGTYTATENRTFESLVVATPTGTADAHTVTVFDHTTVPGRTITVNGENPQFNVANHYNDVWFKGGNWNFSGYFYLGNENSSTLGKDTFRRLYITDGASLSGAARLYVNYGNGGNEMYVSNATVSVANIYVQTGSAMTSITDSSNRGKLIVGEGGTVRVSGTLFVQGEYTSSNSRQTGYALVSGKGASLEAGSLLLESASLTRASVGAEMRIGDGGSVVVANTIGIGSLSYTYKPKLFDAFYANDATVTTKNMYVGQGTAVTNALAVISNSTVTVTGDLVSGNGANSAMSSIVFRDCANMTLSDDLIVGLGEGSHDNLIGFYGCGPITLTSGKSWYSGKGEGSYGNVLMISNTVITTDREVAAGYSSTSVSNQVVVAGPQGKVIMKNKQRDPIYYGHGNRFRVTDRAKLVGCSTSLWMFKYGHDSELLVDEGGALTFDEEAKNSLALFIGKVTSKGLTSDNRLIVGKDGLADINSELSVGGTNTSLIVEDGNLKVGIHLNLGVLQETATGLADAPSDGCRIVVRGSRPKLDIARSIRSTEGSRSVLRFELPKGGYSWSDEPMRVAPIMFNGTNPTYTLSVTDDTILEADVSALKGADRDRPIAVASAEMPMSVSETALANANAKGALAKKPYHFSLSDDKKTLFVTAESKGLMLMIK